MSYLKIGLILGILVLCSWLYNSRAAARMEASSARAELAAYQAKVNEEAMKRMDENNRDALIRQRNNERIADAQFQREEAVRKQLALSARANRGLRDTIAELERRPVPENPDARAYADEASTARGLLERCSGRYQWMDGEAKKLGAQVTGLQEFITNVCKAGQSIEQLAPAPAQ